ncbi:asparagine synthase (glutamine-hydrolyzing) [Sorangium sp. So ce693]|uniref:asparagine synthase (glutamine-hydrolyzing) n=1 Tax=Sorangium sp. So ce693 TaxID=3133318 RepID=UPI003F63D933
MCGIVGALDLAGRRTFDPARLDRMAASVRHRGPDEGASFSAPGIAMATRRLAVVDVAGGRQPMADAGGRVWVSYNGELFNHAELRRELAARGHAQRTRCDTELWPGLYLDAGEGAFSRARGQFAVALWDREARTLLLGRDRIGICPLHYAVADGWLLWASEIKAILASGLVRPEADPAGIDHVFSLFAAGTQRTCFRGVRSIWPGHYLRAQGGAVEQRRYWDLDFPAQGEERRVASLDALIEETRACLRDAVQRRLVSDGPVATYLSGGLDSTLVLGLAREARGDAPIASFTVGFDGAGPDERRRATRSAARLGARLETLVPSPAEIIETLPRVVEAAEGPVMDTADGCVLLLAERAARRGFKVVLTGEGADEAMGGYVWHKTHRAMERLARVHPALPRAIRRTLAELAAPGTPAPTFQDHFGDVRPSLLDLYEPLSRARWLFYSDTMAERVAGHDPFSELDIAPARMRRWDPLNRSLYVEYKLMLAGHLLVGKGDRAAMRSGVEHRYPFLDEAFVELSSGLSPAYKLRGLREKWLLREVARRVLPRDVADPPKGMFKAHALCALGPQPRWIAQLVSPESLRKTGYFSPAKVAREQRFQRILPALAPRRIVADGSYTAVVTTQLWHHLFLGGGLCELPAWSPPAPAAGPAPAAADERAVASIERTVPS